MNEYHGSSCLVGKRFCPNPNKGIVRDFKGIREREIYCDEPPSYSTVSQAFSSNTIILIKGNFSATHYFQEMLEIKPWIVEKKYDASLTFKSELGKIQFAIPAEELKKIKKPGDFSPWWLQNNWLFYLRS